MAQRSEPFNIDPAAWLTESRGSPLGESGLEHPVDPFVLSSLVFETVDPCRSDLPRRVHVSTSARLRIEATDLHDSDHALFNRWSHVESADQIWTRRERLLSDLTGRNREVATNSLIHRCFKFGKSR